MGVGGALVERWLLASPSPEATLTDALGFLRGGVSLAAAQEEAWRLSVEAGGGLVGQTDALLTPPLPPALCLPEEGETGPAGEGPVAGLNRMIRRLDGSVRSGDAPGVEEGVDALATLDSGLSGAAGPHVRLAVARSYAWAGDLGLAARVLDQADLVAVDGGDVPIVAASTAGRLFEGGRVTREQAVLAFHLRYLAGLVAHRRERPADAIAHFRRALNAVNYLVGPGDDLGAGGHYQRTSMAPGTLACGREGESLTSLDAYTGLVAAYMAARDFRDPTRLAREVGRRGYEVDPDDPLTPLLVHAQDVARGEEESPIPEHVFWASSNLQRVYHYNRLRPDRRLALTRAVLTLRVLADSSWTSALGVGGDETCDMLAGLAGSLHQDSEGPWSLPAAKGVTDSAWAAVAVHTFARLEADCPGQSPPSVDAAVRGEWLRLGGTLLHAGLVARYESLRAELERSGATAPAPIVQEAMARVASDRRYFASGRIPPDLSVALDPALAAAFVERWQEAVFREVAHALVEGVGSRSAPNRIRAGDAGSYLEAVNGAVRHGGLTPADAYRLETLAVLAWSNGARGAALYRLSYHARSHPGVARATLASLLFAAMAAILVGFVSWWRYTLLTRADFFALESAGRLVAPAETPRGQGASAPPAVGPDVPKEPGSDPASPGGVDAEGSETQSPSREAV